MSMSRFWAATNESKFKVANQERIQRSYWNIYGKSTEYNQK